MLIRVYGSILRAGIKSKVYTAWENDSNCNYTVVNYTIFRHALGNSADSAIRAIITSWYGMLFVEVVTIQCAAI